MRLQKISIRSMPGINPGFELDDLEPGINVIHGPNGSGKTSLCRAVHSILWPGGKSDRHIEATTKWESAPDGLHGETENGRVSWQRGGMVCNPPMVPAKIFAQCYTIGLTGLLQKEREQTDRDITRDIYLAMSGDYDIESVRDDWFPAPKRRRAMEHKALHAAKTALRNIERDHRELSSKEDALADLRCERDRAISARKLGPYLDHALELARARSALEDVRAALDELPSELVSYHSNDKEQLSEFEQTLKTRCDEIADLDTQLEEAKGQQQKADLDDKDLDALTLNIWRNRAGEIRDSERELKNARADEAGAEQKREDARSQLSGHTNLEDPPSITKDLLERIGSNITERQTKDAKLTGIRQQLGVIERAAPDAEADPEAIEDLGKNIDLLREWLAASAKTLPPGKLHALVAAVLIPLVGAAIAYFAEIPWLGFTALGGLVLAIPALHFLLQPVSNEHASLQDKIADRDLKQPGVWSRASVGKLLKELDQKLARANLQKEYSIRREVLRASESELTTESATLAGQRRDLATELGVDVSDDLTLIVLADRLHDLCNAEAELAADRSRIRQRETKIGDELEAAESFIESFGYDSASCWSELDACLTMLQKRLDDHATATRDCTRLTKARNAAEGHRADAHNRLQTFYERRGLSDDDEEQPRQTVLDNLKDLPGYENLTSKKNDLERQIDRTQKKLTDYPELLELSEDDATSKKEDKKSEADKEGGLLEAISAIEATANAKSQGDELAQAIAVREAAEVSLDERRYLVEYAAAGRFLLTQVEEQHEKDSLPPVLEHAMRDFAAFTRNNYELLHPQDRDGELRALDTRLQKGLALSELSDGTRIQLLLAVRLAFARREEGEDMLPLFLDETLTTADPERFRAVADSLTALVSDGRQIFYLTANPSDAACWQAIGKGSNVTEPRIIDLGQIRGLTAAADATTELDPPKRPAVPNPAGMTREDYGRALGVPAVDFNAPVHSLHMFHVMGDELAMLYNLMRELRIDYVGPWESFSRSERANSLLEEEDRRRIDARVRCARSVFESRAIGRGRPVDRNSLEQSKAITPSFFDRITELAEELHGDAKALLRAIGDGKDERTKRFRTESREKLAAFLEDKGYIDPQEPLDEAAIRIQTLTAIAAEINSGSITMDDCHALVDYLLDTQNMSA